MTLQPGTTYHYRVLAVKKVQSEDGINWQGPPVAGPDRTFETQPVPFQPAPGAIEPPPVNPQIEREFEEHPPWDHAPVGPSTEAPKAVVTKGGVSPKPRSLTTAQKLARALQACKREPKHKQPACKRRVEQKYASAHKAGGRGA